MARIAAASHRRRRALTDGWQLTELSPGTEPGPAGPRDLETLATPWLPALVPGTVASSLRAAGRFSLETPKNFDASEYWYRTRFDAAEARPGEALRLSLAGLATLSDVWLNGEHLLRSENMYHAHELDVSSLVRAENELVLRFASLEAALAVKRPRPRFKTRMVDRQQLRWFRTTFLGRMPGWSPNATSVGPWRAVALESQRGFTLEGCSLRASLEGGRALVRLRLELGLLEGDVTSGALRVGAESAPLTRTLQGENPMFTAELQLAQAERWWPNGYGEQPRYPASVTLQTSLGEQRIDFDPLAFRTIEVLDHSKFALRVNGVDVRCRGACWAPVDVVSLADDERTQLAVEQAHAAGMNMLRVGGTMVYESDAFYEACDRLGILVWQDYMFANCDYPGDDPAFRASVEREAKELLARLEARPSLAVLCGGSEVEQQIAMLGLPRETWKPPLFAELLRELSQGARADVPYLSSSPTGGPLPFQANDGVTHYYGVGAYLRPLEDARRADVKFASECLAFANVPEPETLQHLLGDVKAPFHEPLWKARVPRDNGVGWDFDDVRDHYVRLLFGVDPVLLRYQDPERALALARVASGEVMARTLGEWRRGASSCRGALIWLLRDLWPGAGWGIVDAHGRPKAAYYFVKRALQPRAVFLSDEGVNGLYVELVNDRPETLHAEVELLLVRGGSTRVASGSARVEVGPHATLSVPATTLLEHFIDLTHAYRFGPPAYDVAVVTLLDAATGERLSDACHFPSGLPSARGDGPGLEACAHEGQNGSFELQVTSAAFAQSLAIDVPGYVPDDSYFNLAPGQRRAVALRPAPPIAGARARAKPAGTVTALNAHSPVRITLAPAPAG